MFEDFSKAKLVVVGDVMLDRYVHGHVNRISPEAPVPVLSVERETMTIGGAGNVAANIASLGGHVDFISVIGNDAGGKDIQKLFREYKNITSNLLLDAERRTTVKTRFTADEQQLLRADEEDTHNISMDIEGKIMDALDGMDDRKIMILSDYGKGVLNQYMVNRIIKKYAYQSKIIIDPKSHNFAHYAGAFMLTPNRNELSNASKQKIATIEDADAAARRLMAEHGIASMLVTMGKDGVCLVVKDNPAQHFHSKAIEVFDVSGAGDSVLATLATAMGCGRDIAESAELANLAGSIVVGKHGTSTLTTEELAEMYHQQPNRNKAAQGQLPLLQNKP